MAQARGAGALMMVVWIFSMVGLEAYTDTAHPTGQAKRRAETAPGGRLVDPTGYTHANAARSG